MCLPTAERSRSAGYGFGGWGPADDSIASVHDSSHRRGIQSECVPLFEERRVGKYLRLAGGPAREADRHQIFVLRADGSVVHRASGNSIFDSSDLDNVRLYPGDTIVVPEKIVRPSGLRELTAWTEIMSQLSLSAAALDVVK